MAKPPDKQIKTPALAATNAGVNIKSFVANDDFKATLTRELMQ